MQDFLTQYYLWFKALHVVAMVAWMAGLFYLPRLFVYHVAAKQGSDQSETFKVMERKLLKIIMNPAMIVTWLAGLLMLWLDPSLLQQGWMHTKLLAVVLLSGVHGVLAKHTRMFAADKNIKSDKYFRVLNEIPTVLLIIVVIMVIVRPF